MAMYAIRRVVKYSLIGGSSLAFAGALYANNWNPSSLGVTRFGRAAWVVSSISFDYRFSLRNYNDDSEESRSMWSSVHTRSAEKLLKLCSTNGGVFIKVGQHIAALEYLVPHEYCEVLKVLHDHAPESTMQGVREVIRKDLGKEVEEIFEKFEDKPVGTASLAQVHKAKIRDGPEVAVKVQHPKVRDHSLVDMATMDILVNIVARVFPEFSLLWLAQETRINLPRELDFVLEAKNCEQVGRMFSNLKWLKVPEVIWEYTSSRVLTMEYLAGGKVTDKDYMIKNDINLREVSERIGELYSEMIFVQGYVHCDPHPGNILVSKVDGKPQIILLDHGLYSNLPEKFRHQYSQLWFSLINSDIAGVKKWSLELGAGDLFPLLACILAGKTWDTITQGLTKTRPKAAREKEDQELRVYARQYVPQINAILSRVPREMLLLFKTNDLLREIDCGMDLDLPGGVITTHCVSTVVRPGSKQTHDPLQFVKIQSTELSKKAVEQIRLAEEVKITKEKIKEVEEEWQNNLLNWKSKRRKSRSSGAEEDDTQENSHRKIKTFSEILNEKAKSGHRIGYNLHKYVGLGDEEGDNDGDDEIVNRNERTKESSNGVGFLASSYEEQQAQLQKKREELSNKLQELQELENKQRELERQAKEGVNEQVNRTENSNDAPITPKNTLNSEEFQDVTSNIHPAIDPETDCNWNQILLNQEMRQSPKAIVDDNQHQNGDNTQYSIDHEKILETNDKNRVTSLAQSSGLFSRSDESESENDHPDEHTEVDAEAEREQMLSFKAKLSTFENLSKSKIDEEISKPKPSPSKMRFHKSASDAQIDISNQPDRPFKSRPPAVEDLARSEELRVAQRRRQNFDYNEGFLDNDPTSQRHQTSVMHLGTGELKPYLGSTHGLRGNDPSKFNPSSAFSCSEDNRGSWDQQNYVCDKEVEIISERMNRLPGPSDILTMPDTSTALPHGGVPKFVPQTCDIGLPPLNSVHPSFYGKSVPSEIPTLSNVHQQQQYLGSEQYQQRPRCRQPISIQRSHYANELYANQNQFAPQKQMPSLPTHLSTVSQRDSFNPQLIYSNQFFDPRISQVSVPIKTQEPVLPPIYQAPHGYESYRQRPCFHPQGGISNALQKSSENPHILKRNPDDAQSSSEPQNNSLSDRHSNFQQIGNSQLASNMSSQRLSYNHNHWVIQEAELRRLHSKGSNVGHIKGTGNLTNNAESSPFENHVYENTPVQNTYGCTHQTQDMRGMESANSTSEGSQQGQNQILSVSGKKKCSNCGDELGRGCAAMVIETLSLYYHINCFRCFVCHTQLGNGSCGTDVRVRNQKLHCHNCYSNDEAGLKFSRV